MADKLVSAKQVADCLGMHPKTLYKALRENRIALNFVRRTARGIAFRPRDVENYINKREVVRTGGGVLRKRRKETVKERLKRKYNVVEFMTDEEAQEFFAGMVGHDSVSPEEWEEMTAGEKNSD